MNTLYCLRKLNETYGTIRVAFCNRKTKKWFHCEFPSKTFNAMFKKKGLTLHRQIMHDEIVIETDLDSWYENRIINLGVVDKCLNNKWSFKSWTSGNKSFHTHMFFPQLRKINTQYKLKHAKELFIKWFFDDLDENLDEIEYDYNEQSNCKRLGVDLLTGQQMIRAEYQKHEKTKRNKIVLFEHYNDVNNRMPIKIIKKFNEWCKNIKKYKPTKSRLPCINYLLSNELKDGKKRALFILAAHLKFEMNKESLTKLLLLWSNNLQNGEIKYGTISSIVYNQYRNKMKPGCRYIKQVLTDAGLKSMCQRCENER